MAKVLGIGGIFLKANDPKMLSAWYATHLGIERQHGAIVFEGPDAAGTTVFSHFPQNTDYFGDGPQQSMVNFRVDDIDGLMTTLAAAGVRVDPNRGEYDYGRFAWFWDPEGNRVELWQETA